jgi:beta-glucanase (GH16 family)
VCTFDDEFDRTTHDAHHLIKKEWLPQLTADSGFRTGPPSEPACYISSHHNIWVSNGRLHLRVRKFPRVFSCATADGLSPWLIKDASAYPTHYTAGSVSTFDRFAQEYGRFAVRARVPKTRQPGLHEALWLWPSHPRRYGTGGASGEIDFAEFYSNFAKHVIPYVHYLLGPGNHNSDAYWNTVTARCPIRWGRFNTYVARWRPGIIRLTVNGATCLTNRYRAANVAPPAPFNQPFIIALTAGLGQTANALNRHATPFPATTTIAWVRVWKRG